MNLGKYQLLRKLATGGMAEVYLARIAGPGGFEKLCVLKRILPHLAEEQSFVSMFRSEAKLAAQLNHPNVVSIFDFGQEGESWFLVMEYIDGPSLRWLCRRAQALNRPLGFNIAAAIVSAACEGLAFAHDFADPETGNPLMLVHRDISADNILMGRNGVVKVVDFGIARVTNQTRHTQTGAIRGKLSYMPPELIRGEEIDRRADIFALGVVLYELLCGTKPFEAPTDAAIMQSILFEPFRPVMSKRPDMPPELQHVIERALEKTREQRYQDCREMQADLERFIAGQGARVTHAHLAQVIASLSSGDDANKGFHDSFAHVAPTALEAPRPQLPAPSQPPRPSTPPQLPPPPPETATGVLKIDVAAEPEPEPDAPIVLDQYKKREPTPWPTVDLSAESKKDSRSFGMAAPVADPVQRHAAPPRRTPLALAGVAALLVGVGATYLVLRPPAKADPTVVVPTEPVKPAPTPREPVKPEPVVVAPQPEPTPTPDPEVAPQPEPPPIAKAPPPAPKPTPKKPAPKPVRVVKAPVRPPDPPPPPPVVEGLVDFRIRPYATVLVDGVLRGVTPLAKLKLPVGVHEVTLRNADLGKTVTLQYKVEPGDNTLKYNLETAP